RNLTPAAVELILQHVGAPPLRRIKFCVMGDCGDFDLADVAPSRALHAELFRLTSRTETLDATESLIAALSDPRTLGYAVSLNVTGISQHTDATTIRRIARVVARTHPRLVCLADSMGALLPTQTALVFEALRDALAADALTSSPPPLLGFHAHNNVQ